MCNNIIVLNSVYTQGNGSYIENKIYWDDLSQQGKKIYIQNEMKQFSRNDFDSDRFNISYFLDEYKLWEKFEEAKQAINIILISKNNSDMFEVNIKDWLDNSPVFSFEIFCSLLNALKILSEFNQFMLNECEQLEKERFECGYPLIVPDNIKFELLAHIARKNSV
jgi:hypothetical protein